MRASPLRFTKSFPDDMLNEGGDGHAHGHGRGQNVGVGLVNVSDHACAHVPGLWQKLFALPLARFRTIASRRSSRRVGRLPERFSGSLHAILRLRH